MEKVDNIDFNRLMQISDGNHMSISDDFCDNGVPYYRGQDIYSFFIENAKPINITETAFNQRFMKRSYLKKGDVLVSIVGAIIGNSSLVYNDIKATCSCKLAILRPTNILPEVLATYIKSRYAQSQIQRYRRGGSQTGLIVEDIGTLKVPIFSELLQNKIKDCIEHSHDLFNKSVSMYTKSEDLLYRELTFDTENEDNSKYVVKSFTESFGKSARLDSEYYQVKYDILFDKLSKYEMNYLHEVVNIQKSVEPGSDYYTEEGIPFVRVSDLSKYGVSEPAVHLLNGSDSSLGIPYPKKDTVLLSKDGSVGIAYKLEKDANFVTSGALLHLIIKKDTGILPDYLTLVLNSKIVQMQAERDAGGSIIQHWKPSEIEKVIIPMVNMELQKKIALEVQKSFALRTKANEMISNAIRAVEIAVESGEKSAIEYLDANK